MRPKVAVLVKIAVRSNVAMPAQRRRAMLWQYFSYRKRFVVHILNEMISIDKMKAFTVHL